MSKTKVNSFVAQFIAQVKGDDVEVKAEKAWRRADSALASQIPALKGLSVGLEDDVANAEASLALARINNAEPVTDNAQYIDNLYKCQNAVTKSEDALKAHLAKIKFLEDQHRELQQEAEVSEDDN